MAAPEKPLLFHYPPSIYSHRVLWYLWLRGLPYDECIQPAYMPRPDLASININYRRIPILAIGKDIYCDSRLIIKTLEERFPGSNLSPRTSQEAGIKKLFESWSIDGGLFANAVKLIPYWTSKSLLKDKAFLDDRQQLMGGVRFTPEERERNRPDGLTHIRQAFEVLENTWLADGRKWILGGDAPSVVDIDAVWPFEWVVADKWMAEALPKEYEQRFPRVYAYVRRFLEAANEGRKRIAKPTTFDRKTVEKHVLEAKEPLGDLEVIEDDPLKLKNGDEVDVYPSDYGMSHKDRGSLIGLTISTVTIRNSKGLNLHFPRWNFRVEKVQSRLTIPASISSAKNIPKMKLIYHHGSPYTRKVYMVALEHRLTQHITLEKVVVCPIPYPGWSDNNEDVAVYNPMAKIPCLVPEDVPDGIFDSRIICEYLESLAGVTSKKDAKYFTKRTLHACADGILDAGVLRVYEKRIREERGIRFEEWMKGQELKMLRGLDRLEVAASSGILCDPPSGPASADEIAVACAVSFSGQLGIQWQEKRPKLAEWFSRWESRRSFQESPPDNDWQTGAYEKKVSKI
ncbi:hypothetical protein BDV96DRAFT_590965 [Lophiotrema nucula]|uniref:GST N-terminal domain-containing protein n=1 Tax=Lophiotrema nucula TaxID=690887 RepID=A0A6A5YHM4_9PLEO|nr:hypothetical protein BDV96DRAFT_590965 [Lophiotrema nucula]